MTLHSSSSGRLPSMRAPVWPLGRSVIADAEVDHQHRHGQRKERADGEDKEIQRVDVLGERRSLVGEDGNAEYLHELCPARAVVASDRDEYESNQRHERDRATEPHCPHRHEPVIARRRIVVIAVKQQPLGQRADLLVRRLDQRELHVARRIVDAEKIPRQLARRRCHDDAARVRELLRSARPSRS